MTKTTAENIYQAIAFFDKNAPHTDRFIQMSR